MFLLPLMSLVYKTASRTESLLAGRAPTAMLLLACCSALASTQTLAAASEAGGLPATTSANSDVSNPKTISSKERPKDDSVTITDAMPDQLVVSVTPVDVAGNSIRSNRVTTSTAKRQVDRTGVAAVRTSLTDAAALSDLIAPIALYPDELLAIILPATQHPLDLIAAARTLRDGASTPSINPALATDTHESVTALMNYPTILFMLNDNLPWLKALGAAVGQRRQAVMAALQNFRDKALRAGQLESSKEQIVEVVPIETDRYVKTVRTHDLGSDYSQTITIRSALPDRIYIPEYDPYDLLYRPSRTRIIFSSRAWPVYYYPYRSNHTFYSDSFWGVDSVFGLSWVDRSFNRRSRFDFGHPFYGSHYPNHFYARTKQSRQHGTKHRNKDLSGDRRGEWIGNRPADRRSDRDYQRETYVSNRQAPERIGDSTNTRTQQHSKSANQASKRDRSQRQEIVRLSAAEKEKARTRRENLINIERRSNVLHRGHSGPNVSYGASPDRSPRLENHPKRNPPGEIRDARKPRQGKIKDQP